MDDRSIMENLLLTTKGVCDLYLHGAEEAGTPNVRSSFSAALTDALTMQDTIYKAMSAKGWYTADEAPQPKINEVRQKFAAQ